MDDVDVKLLSAGLRACPFCSGEPVLEPMPAKTGWWRVRCQNFHCGGTNWAQTDAESAVEKWQKRSA